ncbi:unnamed protein product [marine sediment metagenome]|uniref:Uncharacterized protein n=1 Tax=marine sediment metagenome TaxID=412755 RepID=X1TN29_9ZZZZ
MPTLLVLKGPMGIITFCGPACYNNKDKTCTCICKGSNHGSGYDQALQNSLTHISRFKKDDPDIHLSLHSKRQKAKLEQSTLIF